MLRAESFHRSSQDRPGTFLFVLDVGGMAGSPAAPRGLANVGGAPTATPMMIPLAGMILLAWRSAKTTVSL
jgi:hypothetical protein